MTTPSPHRTHLRLLCIAKEAEEEEEGGTETCVNLFNKSPIPRSLHLCFVAN